MRLNTRKVAPPTPWFQARYPFASNHDPPFLLVSATGPGSATAPANPGTSARWLAGFGRFLPRPRPTGGFAADNARCELVRITICR